MMTVKRGRLLDKVRDYAHGYKEHVSLVSVLAMVNHGIAREGDDWHVELLIWRIGCVVCEDDL